MAGTNRMNLPGMRSQAAYPRQHPTESKRAGRRRAKSVRTKSTVYEAHGRVRDDGGVPQTVFHRMDFPREQFQNPVSMKLSLLCRSYWREDSMNPVFSHPTKDHISQTCDGCIPRAMPSCNAFSDSAELAGQRIP